MSSLLKHVAFSLLGAMLCACASQTVGSSSGPKAIVFLSDFGTEDASVAIVKGVILSVDRNIKVIDLTHQVPAFSIEDAARFLKNASAAFPSGTVFLASVDRQRAGKVKGVVAKTKKGQYFVVPNNGLISAVEARDGVEEVREIVAGSWVKPAQLKSTFLAREVYAPVAARIALGEDWTQVGPVVGGVERVEMRAQSVSNRGVSGEVVAIDGPFGNLITNITSSSLLSAGYSPGDKVGVRIGTRDYQFPFVNTFSDVPVGESLLYVDSTDAIAIAINQGNFAKKFRVRPPIGIRITQKKKE